MTARAADAHVLVVDDVPAFCEEVRSILRPRCGRVTVCTSPLRALRLLRTGRFDLLVTTLVMKELGGFGMIRRARGQASTLPIMMITGHGNERTAIEATRLGVSDYLEKPVSADELCARVEKILSRRGAKDGPARACTPSGLITEDSAMLAIVDTIAVAATSDSRVLVLGETGTGKQLVAQAIHAASPRAREKFIEINCAAIPENLLESELFGHERGAFTGAADRRIGRFEEAGAGTLFLDEIGEMNFAVQSKLLRVLQSGEFSRVGGNTTLRSRARVIAATNRDLQAEVDAGRFRSDVFYRLQVITLTLPPLRRRLGDVPLLANHFLSRFRGSRGYPKGFSPEALNAMQRYLWPGNVRELEHFVERFAVLHDRPWIELDDLPEKLLRERDQNTTPMSSGFGGTYAESRAAWERSYVEQALRSARGNMAAAARRADVDRSFFFRLVKRHDLDPKQYHGD